MTTTIEDHDPNDFRDEIKCPHCGKEDHEHTEYPSSLRMDGDSTQTECGYCGKPMHVTLCVEYTYATRDVCPECTGKNLKPEVWADGMLVARCRACGGVG